MFNRLKEITIMKKYIAPSVEILNVNTESMLALSIQTGSSDKGNILSNDRNFDTDWDDED